MKKIQIALVASLAIGTASVPVVAVAQTPHKTHHRLATVAGGLGAYTIAKHSNSRFLRKHRFAAGIAGAWAAHHYMKKHDRKVLRHRG